MSYRVVLLDPAECDTPEVIHECDDRSEAESVCVEWEKEPLGFIAVVWPEWAAIPGVLVPVPSPTVR